MKALSAGARESQITSRPEAAVAIIRCAQPEDSVLLLRRNIRDSDPWSGHFAFPGGRREEGDDSIYATCIRETYEETGIILKSDSLLRILPPTRAGRNVMAPVLVQPYVFEIDTRPGIIVEEKEIESYLWLNTRLFLEQERHVVAEVLPDRHYQAFPLNDYFLWGFTYGLLCQVLDADRS